MKEFKQITTVYARGRKFYVIYDAEGKDICGVMKHYWGVEATNFNDEGRLVNEVNGWNGHLSETVEECVEQIRTTVEIQYIRETTGCTPMEAVERFYEARIGA